ncbi:MAG: Obg family GTPase CgtA, partial [Oscillospiraceae bacterium]|nr:Obg family GTPase CgtA [Oscillospiraceae bacterium]
KKISESIAGLCVDANTLLGEDIRRSLASGLGREEAPLARETLKTLLKNADIASEEQIAKFGDYIKEKEFIFFVTSSATKKGLSQLLDCIFEHLSKLPPVKSYQPEPLSLAELEEIQKSKRAFKIQNPAEGYFVIDAPFLAPIIAMANMDDYESLQYLQRVLRSSGIIDALEDAGVQEKDTVAIFDFEFDYVR